MSCVARRGGGDGPRVAGGKTRVGRGVRSRSFGRHVGRPSLRNVVSAATSNGASPQTAAAENVVIIGSGPAGYTAAIYAARANLRPTVFEGFQVGGVKGGQLMTTTEVENFPGFPEGITGPDLMERMAQQAERWGSILHQEDVVEVDLSQRPFTVRSAEREVKTHSIILAMGATAKRLGLPREHEFWSRGISACAICDGGSPIFKNKEVAVVGGGDTAVEEAIYLTKYAKHVHMLVRSENMRASKAMQDRVMVHPRVTVHFNTNTLDILGDSQMTGLSLSDSKSGEKRELMCQGMFYGIGHSPNSSIVKDKVELDASGYVKVSQGVRTSVEGVYCAGDLHDHEWRQAVTAAGSGCMSAIAAERYLAEQGTLTEYHQTETTTTKGGEEEEEKNGKGGRGGGGGLQTGDEESEFNIEEVRHRGQYALRKLYHSSERVISVLYTSPTCGPCRSLKPILHKVVDEFGDQIHFVEIDIDEDPEIAEAAGITGTPTVQFFKKKEKIAHVNGVKMKTQYREIINSNMQEDDEASSSSTPSSSSSSSKETTEEKMVSARE